MTAFGVGSWVRHPKRPDWGIGEVVGADEDTLRVLFSEVGEKKIKVGVVVLESVEAPVDAKRARPRLRARSDIDMTKLEHLCHIFHGQLKDRRSTTDDGSMATKVLDEIRNRGDLSRPVKKQLFSWCHTGASYQEGVDLAQQICLLVYGRVPTQSELKAIGIL